ncbi:MAG: hypothetical protein IJ100_04025, partial [Lachnospiraceae bacterium]|nr:hypothetical protein [Lachnospiraceae bacterium]
MPGICMKTENDIVNKVGKMRFSGNVIPEVWYKTIVSSNGRVNLLAINILADIVYWYRPMETRDEMTGDVTWKKKFADDDYLQRNYSKICEKYNVSAFCGPQWPPVRLPVATRRCQWTGLISYFSFDHYDVMFRHPFEKRVGG